MPTDRKRVDPIVTALRAQEMNVSFFATAPDTGDFGPITRTRIRAAQALVILYSQASAQPSWADASIHAFQPEVATDSTRPIVIVKLDETVLPSSLENLPIVDAMTATPAPAVEAISRLIRQTPSEPQIGATAAPPNGTQTRNEISDRLPHH